MPAFLRTLDALKGTKNRTNHGTIKTNIHGKSTRKIYGRAAFGARPLRLVTWLSWHKRYFCPMVLWPRDTFPDYAVGLGYLFHSSRAECLFRGATRSDFMPFEDVFVTGILGDACGLAKVDVPNFA